MLAVREISDPAALVEHPLNTVTIDHPETLLTPRPAGAFAKFGSAMTMHAHTILTATRDQIEEYCSEQSKQGINIIYLVGAFKTSPLSGLMTKLFMQEWAVKPESPEHHAASVFSIMRPRTPNSKFNDAGLSIKEVVDIACNNNIAIALDFVTNTIGIDSPLAIFNPQMIEDYAGDWPDFNCLKDVINRREKTFEEHSQLELDGCNYDSHLEAYREGANEIFHYVMKITDEQQQVTTQELFLERDFDKNGFRPYALYKVTNPEGKEEIYCKNVGHFGGNTWGDVLALKLDHHDTLAYQREILKTIYNSGCVIRADMAGLPLQNGYPNYWQELLSELPDDMREKMIILGETYWSEAELASCGVAPYVCKVRDSLEHGQIAELMKYVFESDRQLFENLSTLGSLANHDDAPWLDHLKTGAAMAIVCSLPLMYTLLPQGGVHGIYERIGADRRMSWDEFTNARIQAKEKDAGFPKFMQQLMRVAQSPVFRSPHSDFKTVHFVDKGDLNTALNAENKIFNIARILDDQQGNIDRVFTVVNYGGPISDKPMTVELAFTFDMSHEDLAEHVVVNLFTGEYQQATPSFDLHPEVHAFQSHMYALVHKKKLN